MKRHLLLIVLSLQVLIVSSQNCIITQKFFKNIWDFDITNNSILKIDSIPWPSNSSFSGIFIDQVNHEIYYSVSQGNNIDKNGIYKIAMDGSNKTIIMEEEFIRPGDLIVDLATNSIYCSGGFEQKYLYKMNLDGTNIQEIYEGVTVYDITYNPDLGIIYFLDWRKIMSVHLNDLTVQTVYASQSTNNYFNNIACEVKSNQIFFTEQRFFTNNTENILNKLTPGGNPTEVLSIGENSFSSLSINQVNRNLYWSHWNSKDIFHKSILNSTIETISSPLDIVGWFTWGDLSFYDPTVSTNYIPEKLQISLFPNPTHGDISISTDNESKHLVNIYDLNGSHLNQVELAVGENHFSAHLTSGLYLFEITHLESGQRATEKVLIQE